MEHGLFAAVPKAPGVNIAQPREKTSFERVDEAFDAAHQVVNRVESLRVALVGGGQRGEAAQAKPVPSGAFGALAERAGDVRERLLQALDDLDAIGRALP